MTSPIDLVLSRLDGFRLRENGRDRWRACCPAHGGKNPSALSIGIGQEGQVLLKCWHGCEVDQIAGSLGLDLTDLFPPRESTGKPAQRRRLISATQALDLLNSEAHLLIVCASDMVNGVDLGDDTRDRLLQAAARIALLQQEARA